MYLTLFIVSAYTFARRHRLQVATLNLPMTITAVCMIVLATAQLSVDTANIFVAFLHRTREERIAFLSDTGTKWFSTKHSILIAQWIIGDSFVVSDSVFSGQKMKANLYINRPIDAGLYGADAYGSLLFPFSARSEALVSYHSFHLDQSLSLSSQHPVHT